MTHRRYETPELIVDVRGLGTTQDVRLNIEHQSGAALMVPRAETTKVGTAIRICTTGFDGTVYTVDIEDEMLTIMSSAPSVVLGNVTKLEVPRVQVRKAEPGPLRVTGDEETMPIQVGDD